MPITKKTLVQDGFTGFRVLDELEIMRVPQGPGIFAILQPEGFEPVFLAKSTAGTFKKKDPSLKKEALEAEWVTEAKVLYLGKASAGSQGNRGLRKQIQEFMDYGRGRPTVVWDARLIWQLRDAMELVIAWKEFPAAEVNKAEASYHADFVSSYGRLPYANMVQARAKT
ncbi:hypothetical protein [Arthrobacter sp. CJ23]|uniref:hypothetical protein n=1 Tax=Arthrobacter sp. CJ23 TaxID=2972479 RepID=UPI00215C7332|nr:hypothetical protein [Arthrobacter sp. CJ23]UVJ39338.1 hypothetical protein NVV90_19420 [Arthrobacter sp. CJ23]